MLTFKDSQKKFEELLSLVEKQEISFNDIPRLHLKWTSENYDRFDEDARKQIDVMYDNLFDSAQKRIKEMPDSIINRKLYRTARAGKGEHYKYENLFNVLATKPDLDSIQLDGESIAVSGLQNILDLLHDMSEREKSDHKRIAPISLIYGCIDEFSSALYLARHHYYLQANSHLRTVLETLDKISLFVKFPEYIDIFLSHDQEEARKKLSPANVRIKIGSNKRFDYIYNFLSSLGPHPSLRTFQSRTSIQLNQDSKKLVIKIGGTNYAHLKIWFYFSCIMIMNFTLYRTIDLTKDSIIHQEAAEMMETESKKIIEFTNNNLIPWAKREDIDVTEIKNVLNYFPFGNGEENSSTNL